ncbi:hypothetical protein HYFRA_00000290 [Hymenoscyphus fraxineus]|uniref:Uncharacterized protein n=1 Tax=Hymenoscyphus fraxineus TaxID=746836 RepID=A0A9N9L4E8_9HELO|nr:hypothetical protein HYFRA_00000290 [Hymenoscyphus fraxineus]
MRDHSGAATPRAGSGQPQVGYEAEGIGDMMRCTGAVSGGETINHADAMSAKGGRGRERGPAAQQDNNRFSNSALRRSKAGGEISFERRGVRGRDHIYAAPNKMRQEITDLRGGGGGLDLYSQLLSGFHACSTDFWSSSLAKHMKSEDIKNRLTTRDHKLTPPELPVGSNISEVAISAHEMQEKCIYGNLGRTITENTRADKKTLPSTPKLVGQ